MITYSIIQKSHLEGGLRLDAEYYQPEYLEVEKRLNNIKTERLDEISESVVSFGAYSLTNYIKWEESGVPYLNVENIRNGRIEFDDVKFISEHVDEILKKSAVREGQIIITMAGTIGEAAVAHKTPKRVNSNQATAKIILKKGYSPYYLSAFLNSSYGRSQTEREIVSSVQPNIFLGQIKNFKVPLLSKSKQKEIEQIYIKFLDEIDKSKLFYYQAEELLLEELGLKDFQYEDALSFVVNLSDVKSANRTDAEYFQPKYDKLVERLKKRNAKLLKELVRRVKAKIRPKSEEVYKYIEISDVSVGSGDVSFNEIIGKELPANARIPIKGGELLVSKVRPTRGAIAIVPNNFDNNFICSGAFSVFSAPEILREYLFLVLRSIVGKLQFEKPTTGTSYPTITDGDVENLIIPVLPKFTQQKIADLVQKSHEARKKSKQLLEKAKRKVEDMIEKGGINN